MVSQRLTSEDPGITGFGDYYGVIANVNIFLQKTKEADYMEESEKSYYLAQAYGLRAFYYLICIALMVLLHCAWIRMKW